MTQDTYEQFNDLLIYGPQVLSSIVGRGVPHHDAEDIRQGVWMKALSHLIGGKPLPPCREAWLRRIAANDARQYHRQRGVAVRRWKRLTESGKAHTDCDPFVESKREAAELRCSEITDAMMAAFESLDPDLREVVKARFVDGRTLVEIAAWLRLHVNTVKKRENRALELLLRRKLEDCGVALRS